MQVLGHITNGDGETVRGECLLGVEGLHEMVNGTGRVQLVKVQQSLGDTLEELATLGLCKREMPD